jgi:hypothetical protein
MEVIKLILPFTDPSTFSRLNKACYKLVKYQLDRKLSLVLDKLLYRLDLYRKQKEFNEAVNLASRIKLQERKLTIEQRIKFLDNYYISAFYVNKGLAQTLAKEFVHLTQTNTEFYQLFLHNSAYYNKNLGFTIPTLIESRNSNVTLVTALFDLGSRQNTTRRPIEDYLNHGKYILSLPVNLMVYIEPKHVDWVKEQRKDNLIVIPTIFDDLPYYQKLDQIVRCRKINPILNANPNKDTPIYMVTIWSKMTLLQDAITRNPFASTHFGWIDYGLAYMADTRYALADKIFNYIPTCREAKDQQILSHGEIPTCREAKDQQILSHGEIPNKIKLLMLMPYSSELLKDRKEYFKYIRGNIAATLFTGSATNLLTFCHEFDKITQELLNEDLAPSEESIFPLIVDKNPHLFEFYYGDYSGILANYRYHRINFTLINKALKHCIKNGDWSRALDIKNKIIYHLDKIKEDKGLIIKFLELCLSI